MYFSWFCINACARVRVTVVNRNARTHTQLYHRGSARVARKHGVRITDFGSNEL